MRCFPLTCLKVFIAFGACFTTILSIGLLVVTVYSNLKKNAYIDSDQIPIANTALIGLYVSSVLFMIMGIAGLYGSIKKNNSLLCVFFIGTFIFFIVFLFGMLLFFIAPNTVFDGTCQSPKNTYIKQLSTLNNNAQNTFCTDTCPCLLNVAMYQENNITIPFTNFDNSTGNAVLSVKECPQFQSNNSVPLITIMTTLQKQLKCGGWCNDNSLQYFYFFSGSNSANIPQLGCYEAIKSFFSKYGDLLGIFCSGAFVISFINLVMICCFCFHPSKSGGKRNFYTRMMQTD